MRILRVGAAIGIPVLAAGLVIATQGNSLAYDAASPATSVIYESHESNVMNDAVTTPLAQDEQKRLAAIAAAKAEAERQRKLAAERAARAAAEKRKAAVKKQQSSTQKSSTPAPSVSSGSVWDRLAQCESGGNWSINTGNGYYGGLQFSLGSWRGVGGSGYPHQASRAEQIKRGELLKKSGGWGHWPACSKKLGLR